MNRGALTGRTILVTRAEDDAERWAEALRTQGARPVILPCLVCEPIEDQATAARLATAMTTANWLVFTSVRGVESFARLHPAPLDPVIRFAAVGAATGAAVRERFGRDALLGRDWTGAGLAVELVRQVTQPAADVVVAGAAGGRIDVEAALAAAGIRVTRVDVYRTVPAPPEGDRANLAALGVDDILLASPSAVRGLVNRATIAAAMRVITIGPTTTAEARALGLTVAAEARRPTLEGMLEAMR